VTEYLRDPALPPPLDLSVVDSALLAGAPDRLLALAADLLLSGDTARGGEYVDLLERAQPPIEPESRLAARVAALRCVRLAQTGQIDEAVDAALTARAIQERTSLSDEWVSALPMVLLRAYAWLEDYEAVEREAAAALAAPELTEPVKLVQVRGAQALAWFESGHLAQAADAAKAADTEARRLGFSRHFFAVDHLRAPAGLRWSGVTSMARSSSPSRHWRSLNAGGPPSSSWRCWTGPRSGPPAGRSAARWPRSRRHAPSWPGRGQRC
jgi:hypothetical protein